jgi:hypothetical protein
MEMTQVKGVAVTVGATAAFTALLTGSIVAVNEHYDTASSIDTADAFNDLQVKAADAIETGLTDVFSDHCLTLKEGLTDGASPASWVPEKTESRNDTESGKVFTETNVAYSELEDSYDWQWTNTERDTAQAGALTEQKYGSYGSFPFLPDYVNQPSKHTQENLDRLFREAKTYEIDSASSPYYFNPAFVNVAAPQSIIGIGSFGKTPVIAAHCRWIIDMKSNAIKHDTDAPQLKDDLTLSSDPTCGDDEWLIVNGQKAHVTAHGRAYYTLEKPIKGNDVPTDATLIGETDLDFTAPGTQTATIDKPASLNGGYITWVWSIEKNNQPTEWGKYLLQDTTDGWSADDEVVELPKAPEPAPSVSAPTVEPSVAPTPSDVTPSPEPSVTTPTPSESQTLPPTTAPSTYPSASSIKTPVTHTSLAHTGSTTLLLFGLSATALAGGLTLALRKRNVG